MGLDSRFRSQLFSQVKGSNSPWRGCGAALVPLREVRPQGHSQRGTGPRKGRKRPLTQAQDGVSLPESDRLGENESSTG